MADRKPVVLLPNNSLAELPAGDSLAWSLLSGVPVYATRWPTWDEVSGKPTAFPPAAHTHTIAQVTGLQAALDGKAAASHTHSISNITNLQTTLDAKANVSAVQALDTRVTTAEGQISSQGSAITSLTNRVGQAELAGTNQLPNPGFEIDSFWTLQPGWEYAAGEGRNGSRCVKRSARAGGGTQVHCSPYRVPVSPGQVWRIRCWYKTTADFNGTSGNSKFRLGDQNNTLINSATASFTVSTEWKMTDRTYTVPADGSVTHLRVYIIGDNSEGTLWVDDVSLENITELSELQNADAANANAIAGLTTRVTQNENSLTSQGSAITSLQNSVTGLQNTKADASALNALESRVTAAEGTISSTSSSLTRLENKLDKVIMGGPNILADGSFETYKLGSSYGTGYTAVSTARTGSVALQRIANGSTASCPLGTYSTAPNRVYRFSGWLRATVAGVGSAVGLRFRLDLGNGSQTYPNVAVVNAANVPTDGAWLQVSGTYKMPANVITMTPQLVVTSGVTAGTFIFDDIYLEDITEADAAKQTADAAASAVSSLQSTVSQQGDTIASQGSAITALQNSVTGLQNSKADASHTHGIADVTGLQAALDGKSNVGHGHTISDVSGLQAALDGKSPTTHNHDSSYAPKSHVGATGSAHGTATAATAGFMSASDKSKLDGIQAGAINQTTADGRYEKLANKGAANGYASLGADGKIPASQLPAIAITDTFVVNTEAAMLALVAEQGDVAVRTDLNQTFILKAEPASILSNWELLRSPTGAVESVNGQTGAVILTYTDVGAAPSSHDHASISGNAATASKLQTSRTISLTGDATGSASFDGSANASITVTVQDDSHNHVISNVDGLQAALDGKANSAHTHSASDITSGTLSDARLPSTMGGKTFTGAISAPSVGVGTAGGLIYQTASNGSVGVRSGDVGNYRYFRFDADGTFYALNGGGSFSGNVIAYASDGRLKENIEDASAAKVSDFFDRFRVREFDWDYEAIAKLNPAFSPNADHEIGAIAQEVEEIYPLMVACHEHSGIKTIMWEKAVPLLIAEVQALRKRVAALEGGT